MRLISYVLSIFLASLFVIACTESTTKEKEGATNENEVVIIYDTIYMTQQEWDKVAGKMKNPDNTPIEVIATVYMSDEEWELLQQRGNLGAASAGETVIVDTIYMTIQEWKKVEGKVKNADNTPVEVVDTVYMSDKEWQILQERKAKELEAQKAKKAKEEVGGVLRESPIEAPKRDREISGVVEKEYSELKQYNIVVASLSKSNSEGVGRLKKAFMDAGISSLVVQKPQNGMYYFIVGTSDSEAEISDAKKRFLADYVVGKSDKEIWRKYLVHLKDAFVMEK